MTWLRLWIPTLVLALAPAGALAEDTEAEAPAEDADEEADAPAEGADEATEAPAEAGGTTADSGEASEPAEASEADASEAQDPLAKRIEELVRRYYEGIGLEPTPEDLLAGRQSVELMLLDGVSLGRIVPAIDEAIRLHVPGRRVPFHVAVPLRIRPATADASAADTPAASSSDAAQVETAPATSAQATETPAVISPAPSAEAEPLPPVQASDPEVQARREEARQARSAKRARIRLYRQWKERTEVKQGLLSVGIPLLAGGYAAGFAVAGILTLQGLVPHYTAWITAVPVVGSLIFTIWTEAQFPGMIPLVAMELIGTGLIVAALFHKIDWPHKRDPTAQRSRRGGAPPVTLRVVPSGGGALVLGRF